MFKLKVGSSFCYVAYPSLKVYCLNKPFCLRCFAWMAMADFGMCIFESSIKRFLTRLLANHLKDMSTRTRPKP